MTFPARQSSVNGERRSFALLRPAKGEASAQEAIRQCILDAYSSAEAHPESSVGRQAAGPSPPPGRRLVRIWRRAAIGSERRIMDTLTQFANTVQ